MFFEFDLDFSKTFWSERQRPMCGAGSVAVWRSVVLFTNTLFCDSIHEANPVHHSNPIMPKNIYQSRIDINSMI